MDSALIFPYSTRIRVCSQCNDRFVTRLYGEPLDNLCALAMVRFEDELHVKSCFGKERRQDDLR